MSGLLVTLIAAIVKALGADVVSGVLAELAAAQANANAVSLGQAQQARVDQAQVTAAANAATATVAAEGQAIADAPKTVAGVVGRLEDGSA